MKKLMFATALVASVAAFADAPTAINAVGFEGYALGYTPQTGETEKNEDGTDKTEAGYGYFYFDGGEGGASNSSVVTNETPSTTATKRTAYFAEETNTKFLALDTEGGTFWRGLNEISHSGDPVAYGLGAAQPVAATGTYLDTLVQFTVTEDDAPTTTADDKLAIWLGVVTNAQGEVTGTNLMVRARAWGDEGGMPAELTATDFVIANSPVEAGVWYRLTVKAVQAVIQPSTGYIIPAFQIFIDGNPVEATTPQFTSEFQSLVAGYWMEGMETLVSSNKLFPSLATRPGVLEDVTLQGVGFQGTGAVDEIVWTEDDLFPAGGPTVVDYTFTLTLDSNVTGAEVTTNGAAVVFDNGEAQILAGTTVSIAAPTFAQGYQLNTITTNNVAVVDPQFPIAFTMDAAMAVAITSEQIPVTYPTYVGDDATLRTKYDAWKNAYQADTQSQWESAFLLNMDPTASVAEGTALLKIASITEVSGGWELEIVSDATTLTATDGTVLVGNGYLRIIAADTLAGLTTATPSYINVAVTNGKITVTVPASNGKFMKAELTTQAPAQN